MTLTVSGVLKDQVSTYTGTKKHMQEKLAFAGDQMMEALSLSANVSVSTPLEQQLRPVQMITVFMNTILGTIVAFLAILCA